MKKKISLLIGILILALSFTGCSSQSKSETSYDKANLEMVAEAMISNFSQMDSEAFEAFRSSSDFALKTTLYESRLPIQSEDFVDIMNAWEAGEKECGMYLTHGEFETIGMNRNVKVITQAQFEDRNATLEFVFNEKSELESLTVAAKYTIPQILEKAGKNTLIGMGTVFVVLIFISFIISLFKHIPNIQAKFSRKKAKVPQQLETVPSPEPIPVPAVPAAESDDKELIAVISAAIAAAEGRPPEGFVVRSIKRRTTNKWNK